MEVRPGSQGEKQARYEEIPRNMTCRISGLLMAQRGTSQGGEEALMMDLNPYARRFMSSLVVTTEVWIIGKGIGRSRC